MRTNNGSMLLASHFTLPIATRTSEGSNGIKEWAAPANRSVAKHHYMPIVGVHAIQKFRTGQIESVSNHDCCPAHVRRLALRVTTRGASGSRRGRLAPKYGRVARGSGGYPPFAQQPLMNNCHLSRPLHWKSKRETPILKVQKRTSTCLCRLAQKEGVP